MKTCFKCHKTKPLNDFYSHSQMKGGHLGKCKECAKKDVHDRYATPEGRKAFRDYDEARNKTEERKSKKLEYMRQRRAENPEKYKANTLVNNAIRDGRLVRQACEYCGISKAEAHHEDYSKPLEVRWLCFKHHREAHGQLVG